MVEYWPEKPTAAVRFRPAPYILKKVVVQRFLIILSKLLFNAGC